MELELEDLGSNPTDNRPFDDILTARIGRRAVLGGSLATAAITFLGTSPALAKGKPAPGNASSQPAFAGKKGKGGDLLGFDGIPLSAAKNGVVVPDGYTAQVILPWGTAILPGFSDGIPTSAADQEGKIGLGHDGMWFFPTNRSGSEGVLCLNHEYGTNSHLRNGLGEIDSEIAEDDEEFVKISQALHGVAVVKVRRSGDGWAVVPDPATNRRITGNTEVAFSGPVADSPLLENSAGNGFAGTLNNCGSGRTPWGTYLTCEENFNGYFRRRATPTDADERYGLTGDGSRYGWHVHDDRFDLSKPEYANEANRFGWIVEIDPMDASVTPIKRTALGRVKHEAIEIVEGKGKRIVGYMGDDQANDYVYKFVSAANWKSMRARGISPLDEGTLYVARYDEDGTGQWLELSMDVPALNARFSGMDDLLVHTRIAADIVGATPMDRPEWITVDPNTDLVYVACTNNSGRSTANGANPRTPNPSGHIVRMDDGDFVGTGFTWEIFLLAGDPDNPSDTSNGFGPPTDPTYAMNKFSDPDAVYFDPYGRLWILTDGGQPEGRNNQMVVADPESAEVRRFLTGPAGCEVTGITPTMEDTVLFVNIQHPGNGSSAQSNFPSTADGVVPRDATVVITKDDGGVIGS
ncbi:PhoX family phosphatase [Acidimicrobiia bacterium EGI L10123]|uniref:PhoX family protein n=1 Tax=Salinilacustrithrix flava TaxID=2957203 RepID=UPI003D7C1C51|nr:PhoX family phosphatase [Acidimicrobiia bacterium EGI L10123]